MTKELFGWIPDPEGVERILDDDSTDVYRMSDDDRHELGVRRIIAEDKPPLILFDALQKLEPAWYRGAQKIGDSP